MKQDQKFMFFSWCLEAGERLSGNSLYMKGTSVFKCDTLMSQSESKCYILCRDAYTARKQPDSQGILSIPSNISIQKLMMP